MIQLDLDERPQDERLKRLLYYLNADPGNSRLRSDAASMALDCGEPEITRDLLVDAPAELNERDTGLLGLAYIQLGEAAAAARLFGKLVDEGVADPAIRFNLAWSLALEKQFGQALELLDEQVTAQLPQAAMLEVQLLHEKGEFDRAAEVARHHLAQFPEDIGLAAAVSVLALDIEDLELARASAITGGDHPDALTTLGTLELGEQQIDRALEHFNAALAQNGSVPRAWVGRGLAELLIGDKASAAADLDRGAELFRDHIGSWIAAGWAHLIGGDLAEARSRFDRALKIDDNFAESHGSLAVVDVLEGKFAEAEKETAVALRLDRKCFSGGLARALLTARSGDAKSARSLFEKILATPINERGDTVALALAKLGLR